MGMVRLVTVLFKNHISVEEVPFFRGCMIRQSEGNPLFHNHENEGFRYSYPLIQYKCINGYAAMIGINEGGEAIERMAERESFDCCLGNRDVKMEVEVIRIEKRSLDIGEHMYRYMIKRWIPLNRENFKLYQQADRLIDRIDMLEKILVGNILSFAKGLGVFFDSPVLCQISELDNTGVFHYKEVALVSVSIKFRTNVSLPDYIGLGKSASLNNGVVIRI